MFRAAAFWFLFTGLVAAAEPQWLKIEGCTLVESGYRDGDSFLVRVAPRTFRVFRLYFVDACEDTADQRYPERIAEQGRYFGLPPARILELGDAASEVVSRALSKPFTVFTCWQRAPGASSRQRYYAMVVASGGQDLGELLVSSGLVRIYGKRITLPDGTNSRDYLAKLSELELQAKATRIGAWAR